MSAAPAYASTPLVGSALLGAAETSLTVPTTTAIIVTVNATNGGKIEQVRVTPIATTVAGVVYIFLYGGTFYLFDAIQIPAFTASAAIAPAPIDRFYDNLILAAGWSLRASQSIAGNASLLNCTAFGGNY